MSRGHGAVEEVLLAISEEGELPRSRLLWRAFEMHTGSRGAAMSESFYKSARRALTCLAGRGILVARTAKPETFDDIVSAYPWKTRAANVVAMRLRLLPLVAEFLGKRVPRFDHQDAEAFTARARRRSGDPGVEEAFQHWETFALGAIRRALGADVDPKTVDDLLALAVRGRQLFHRRKRTFWISWQGMHVNESLSAIVARLRKCDRVEIRAACDEAEKTATKFFEGSDLRHADLKGQLYSAVSFDVKGPSHLKDELVSHLWAHESAYLAELGCVGIDDAFRKVVTPKASALVHQLLDRKALESVQWISRQRRRPGEASHLPSHRKAGARQ